MNKIKEKVNLADWIYNPLYSPDAELEKTITKVETALGFKLFIWQKTFIERGVFRRYGATTAEILRDLLNVSALPLDYTKHMEPRGEFYKRELREIKSKLDQAGIATRTVFFTKEEKREYAENQKVSNWQQDPKVYYEQRNSKDMGKTRPAKALQIKFGKGRNI